MPTPACLATAVIGAPGSATNTARADSSMRRSLRAASACRPLSGPSWGRSAREWPGCAWPRAEIGSVMRKSVAEHWNKAFRSDIVGTEDFVPVVREDPMTSAPQARTGEAAQGQRSAGPGSAPGSADQRGRAGRWWRWVAFGTVIAAAVMDLLD